MYAAMKLLDMRIKRTEKMLDEAIQDINDHKKGPERNPEPSKNKPAGYQPAPTQYR